MRIVVILLLALALSSCEQGSDIASVKPKTDQSGERRGQPNGNGNGNGNNSQNTDPCANYPVYPVEYSPARDFGITVDTTICGMVIFRWAPQAGFNPVTDTCYTIARYYYISFQNVGHTNGCGPNGGSLSSTNAYYYTLGAGCSLFPSYTYSVSITYVERNTTLQKSIWHSSLPVTFTAGTRAPWLNNCI